MVVYLKNNSKVSYFPLKMCVQSQIVCFCFDLYNLPNTSLPNYFSAPQIALMENSIFQFSLEGFLNICRHGRKREHNSSLQYETHIH